MIAALLLSVACVPSPLSVTPTIRADHDRINTQFYRIYARRPDDPGWTWREDLPYVNDSDYGEFAPSILFDWPVQRMIPTDVQLEEVQFVMEAVSPDGVIGDLSGVITICMPLLVEF